MRALLLLLTFIALADVANSAAVLTGASCADYDAVCPTTDCCGTGTPSTGTGSNIEICLAKSYNGN